MAAPHSALTIFSRGGSKDKLVWTWRNASLPDLSGFGAPLANVGHGFSLCVYDSIATVSQVRMSVAIPPGDTWQAPDSATLTYRDRTAAHGIARLKLRSGVGTAKLHVRGKGPSLGVSLPPPSGTLLGRDPDVTVQLVNRDAPEHCLTASFASARREDPAQFKAAH